MKLASNFLLIIFILTSCQLNNSKNITKYVVEKKEEIKEQIKDKISEKKQQIKKKQKKQIKDTILYVVGDPYYIEGVRYIPQVNYTYNQNGLATFYDKELHNIKTINNDLNKVTELLGRHKTLPLPSIVKITNLENGLFLTIRINDRHEDNTSIIQVSRKVAQLLRFYKNKIARVKIEVLADPSKQMKVVFESMNKPDFDNTIESAPIENVEITDLNEISDQEDISKNNYELPIELGSEDIAIHNLYLKVYGFKSYDEAFEIINILDILFKTTTQNEGNNYSIILGPIENNEVNKLVSSFISKGYKKTEIIIK